MTKPVLTVILAHPDLAVQRKHLGQGALFLPEPEPLPEPFAEIVLRVETSAGESVELDGRVLQILPGHGIAVAFDDMAVAKALLAPIFAAEPSAEDGATFVFWGRVERKTSFPPAVAQVAPEAQARLPDDLELTAEPPQDGESEGSEDGPELDEVAKTELEIEGMNTNQKMQLAMRGGRVARLLLLKDLNKNLQGFIIQNPRITIDEVRNIAAGRQTNPDVLNTIASNRDWQQNQAIVAALVRNPKTPGAIAARLVEKLSISEVRRLAKANDVPRAAVVAARKRLEGEK